jgi:N-carbamoylputrescine amidase
MYTFPEWSEQSFVQLTWPHKDTDWADYLEEAQKCFLNIAKVIIQWEDLLIVTPDVKDVEKQLLKAGIRPVNEHRIVLYKCPTNDTWTRDHGFITMETENRNPLLIDYQFNGWGRKFPADKDNRINAALFRDKVIVSSNPERPALYVDRLDRVLEGGSIDFDEEWNVLTTSTCLLAPNRNNLKDIKGIETWFRNDFKFSHLLCLQSGQLSGDDTDGHIDTLARFAPEKVILYVKPDDPEDCDYEGLKRMERELQSLSKQPHEFPYEMIPLPTPHPIYDENGNRLPATYANFLFINNAILVPTYNQPDKDAEALAVFHKHFYKYDIVGIDCSVLIRQHGSLHCVTMQFPDIVELSEDAENTYEYTGEKRMDEDAEEFNASEKDTTANEVVSYVSDSLRVALIQRAIGQDIEENREMLASAIDNAAKQGAELVVLQELHNTPYFCQVEDTNNFDYAEPIPGPSTLFYGEVAKRNNIVLVTSLFERRAAGLYHNTAVVFERDGSIAGKYRKMHIPDDPAYYEKFYFTPGDLGFHPIRTSVGVLGVQVCWDQWYPEGARLMALQGAELLIYPTAIGWESSDTEEEKGRQLEAWKTVQRGHAVANGIPVIAVNRAGHEEDPSGQTNGIQFWGHSFVAGPQGEILAEAQEEPTTLIVDIDRKRCENVRRWWPFLRDRRIEEFKDLTRRFID